MNPPTRLQIYGLLIAVAVGLAVSRIASAQRVYEPALAARWPAKVPRAVATFSSNDRSRWATVRALVDDGTYVIGSRDANVVKFSHLACLAGGNPLEEAVLAEVGYLQRIGSDRGIFKEDGWESIDRVLNPDTLEFYSSKPPFLATLMAGLYWLLQQITHWTLTGQYTEVVRTLLLLIHPLPFALYLVCLSRLVDRFGASDGGRFFVVIAGCFATFVNPFLNTFNNHTLGTFSVMFCLDSLIAIWERRRRGQTTIVHFLLAGLFAGFAVSCELPALAFAAAVGLLLLWWSPVRTLLLFAPMAGLLAGGFLYTNYLAMGQLRPAYSEFGKVPPFQRAPIPPGGEVEPASPWYQYEGSHWRKPGPGQAPRHGIDWARYYETRSDYILNFLVGHHGFFSLTPIWLLAFLGMLAGTLSLLGRRQEARAEATLPPFLPPLTLFISLLVIGFYLVISENYGGFTVGPRWLIWLTPLLLLSMLPVADWCATRRWARWLAGLLLAISAFSVQYSGWNPWRHPWLYDLMEWATGRTAY